MAVLVVVEGRRNRHLHHRAVVSWTSREQAEPVRSALSAELLPDGRAGGIRTHDLSIKVEVTVFFTTGRPLLRARVLSVGHRDTASAAS